MWSQRTEKGQFFPYASFAVGSTGRNVQKSSGAARVQTLEGCGQLDRSDRATLLS